MIQNRLLLLFSFITTIIFCPSSNLFIPARIYVIPHKPTINELEEQPENIEIDITPTNIKDLVKAWQNTGKYDDTIWIRLFPQKKDLKWTTGKTKRPFYIEKAWTRGKYSSASKTKSHLTSEGVKDFLNNYWATTARYK